MARKKQEPEEQESIGISSAMTHNEDGTIEGTRAKRRGQPSEKRVAFRDFASQLGMAFTKVDHDEDSEAAALREFWGYGQHPWHLRSRTQYDSKDDVITSARIAMNELEDMDEYDDWKEQYPLLRMPPGYAFLFLVEEGMKSLHRASIWEALQFHTGIVSPDMMKSLQKRKD